MDELKLREYMNDFASKRGRDPLLPESWYDVTVKEIQAEKWGPAALSYYGWRMQNLVMSAYTSMNLEPFLFNTVIKQFWEDPDNTRRFFDQTAIKNGFDPLVASNWYRHASRRLFEKVGSFKNGGYKKALARAYKDVGVEESMFDTTAHHFFDSVDNRRESFVKLLDGQGLDPFVMENYYLISSSMVRADKSRNYLYSKRYNCSLLAIVEDIFPDHKWDSSKFIFAASSELWDSHRIRSYFDGFAKKRNFDPLSVEGWYLITRTEFMKLKDGRQILNNFYKSSFTTALCSVYPELAFNLGLFKQMPPRYWQSKDNGRQFFDTFAKKRGFDPIVACNWYNIPRFLIEAEKGGASILNYYGESLIKALQTLYPEVKFDYTRFPKSFQYRNKAGSGLQVPNAAP